VEKICKMNHGGEKNMTKIMVVDDEPDLREMLNLMLHKEGFETETAENGSDFLDKLDEFNPDIVTLDIMMPGLTTSEILKELKEKKSKPKIILLTVVRYSEDEKKKIVSMGNIVDYVAKPFDIDELTDRIHKHIKQQ
jgi:DNA-binding response OmpR family regulator